MGMEPKIHRDHPFFSWCQRLGVMVRVKAFCNDFPFPVFKKI